MSINKPLTVPDCGVAYALTLIGGKWKIAIIWKLVPGRLRFSELRRRIAGVSEGVLINQLKELEKAGIIQRISFNTVPPHVEYKLTPRGHALEAALRALELWGTEQRLRASGK